MTKAIEIIEVSARDGLQNEPGVVSTQNKLKLIQQSVDAGARRIEVASFVHPRIVPQMADAEAVCKALPEDPKVTYVGLVLNQKGLDRAIATEKLQEISCVAVAANGFGQQNQNQSVLESIAVSQRIIRQAKAEGLRAEVTISVAFGCPFDGDVSTAQVVDVATALAEAEPLEIGLADTIGVAVPSQVQETFAAVTEALDGQIPLRAHFHDTRHTAVANAWATLGTGVTRFDASIGGIGGCPFAPSATGNVATEDLLYLFERMGYTTGYSLNRTIDTAKWLQRTLGRPLAGGVSKAGAFTTVAMPKDQQAS